MKIVVYSTKKYEEEFLNTANNNQHQFHFIKDSLTLKTVEKARGSQGVCCFVTDSLNQNIITELAVMGIKLIALRSAGYDHVDLTAAKKHNITVVRVPKYSPQAIAEFATGLILILSRKILQAYLQGLEYNFTLDNLIGFNLYKKTVGIVGAGNIGTAFAQIMSGFDCRILAYDPKPNDICRNLGVKYVPLKNLLNESDIVSLHCLLNEETHHIIGKSAFSQMKQGAMLINTGRGSLVETEALISALESGTLSYAGLDVYEKEQGLYFVDHRDKPVKDEQFLKLQRLPNVIMTPHQAFLTAEAVEGIAKTTIENITAFEQGKSVNQI